MELRGYIQTYETGKRAEKSLVAKLHWIPKNKRRKIEETSHRNYAELWIGTNRNGEAILRKTGEKLSKYIERHPHVLGISSYLFQDKLPFLLKVLSVASPTPIKIHPSERLAQTLHRDNPEAHPDSIHQPVLIVALSDFEMIAGFRPKKDIIYFLQNVPELNELITPCLMEDFIRTEKSYYLKKVFECYINTEVTKLTEVIDNYLVRMETEVFQTRDDHLFEQIMKLQTSFPYDHGVFMLFFLNHFTLKKDEAIYIQPTVPYSFLYGEAVECTTNSNNDIPITFTSDNKQESIFIEYADFTSFEVRQLKVKPSFDQYLTIYDCDEDEFVLYKVTVSKNEYYAIYGKRTLCIFIIIEGTAMTQKLTKVKAGTIMMIPPCRTYYLKALEDMIMFMAEPNLVI